MPKISLIITTYNWKKALRLSLASALDQTRLPDQIIVADDGSSDGTAEMVKEITAKSRVPLFYSWQEDKGFRAARSRNKAIAKAIGDYIIMIDGDIILAENFVEDHLGFARKNSFVQGSRALLNDRKTATLLAAGSIDVSIFDPGVENRKNCLRSALLASLFSWESDKTTGIRTCNFAFWREDSETVNGFNEDFVGWGREDSEFAIRLMNSGVKRRNLRFKGLAYHLYHRPNSRESLAINDTILEHALAKKTTWCEKGLAHHLQDHKIGIP